MGSVPEKSAAFSTTKRDLGIGERIERLSVEEEEEGDEEEEEKGAEKAGREERFLRGRRGSLPPFHSRRSKTVPVSETLEKKKKNIKCWANCRNPPFVMLLCTKLSLKYEIAENHPQLVAKNHLLLLFILPNLLNFSFYQNK